MPANLITSKRIIADITQALEQNTAGAVISAIARTFQSNEASETYAWLGQSPAMREWLGGRSAKDLREFTFQINNKEHEATIEVTKPELRRQKYGSISQRISDLAQRALAYPYKLLTALIVAAESTACYDTQFFFDTDHAEHDSGTQDNDLTYTAATGTTPTDDEMRGAILQAVTKMLGFKDDRGEPINELETEFLVMVPLIYLPQAYAAINLATVANGGQNLIPNMPGINIKAVPNPRLDIAGWTTKMAVFATGSATKPFILQEEMPLNVSAVAEGSELEFNENKHRYGVDWSGNVGMWEWRKATLTTFT